MVTYVLLQSDQKNDINSNNYSRLRTTESSTDLALGSASGRDDFRKFTFEQRHMNLIP
jgi:hypothetical protein